jgi:hypothetical protein
MKFDLAYLHALGEARSCLAVLSDTAADEDESGHYERLLIALDVVDPDGPSTWPIFGDRAALLGRLKASVDQLIELGADPMPLDLIWALAHAPIRGN